MKKVVEFVLKQRLPIAVVLGVLTALSLIAQGWTLVFPVLAVAYYTAIFVGVLRVPVAPADNAYWYPSEQLIKEIVFEMPQALANRGYARSTYTPERNDCDNFELQGRAIFHQKLLQKTATWPAVQRRDIVMMPFSFRRDDNGKRHALFFVVGEKGKKYFIENYPVLNDTHDETGMFRKMTVREVENGYVPNGR